MQRIRESFRSKHFSKIEICKKLNSRNFPAKISFHVIAYDLSYFIFVSCKGGSISATNFQLTQDKDQPDFIQASWTDPSYIKGPLNSYTLFYKQVGSNNGWTTRALPGSFSSFKITDFNAGEEYTGYVVPADATGFGVTSNTANIKTLSGKNILLI